MAASILQGIGDLGTPLTGIYGQFTDMTGEAGDVLDYSTNIATISTSDNFGRDIAGITGAIIGGAIGGVSFGTLGSAIGAFTLGLDGDVYGAILGFIAGGAIGTAGGSLVGAGYGEDVGYYIYDYVAGLPITTLTDTQLIDQATMITASGMPWNHNNGNVIDLGTIEVNASSDDIVFHDDPFMTDDGDVYMSDSEVLLAEYSYSLDPYVLFYCSSMGVSGC